MTIKSIAQINCTNIYWLTSITKYFLNAVTIRNGKVIKLNIERSKQIIV